ncbi:hypothetical protein GCK72_025073 [Caenorhabditis remanei]|uniref:Uncharacterized protein n=1 Tax=Caenorhabditis remanei TaxID=31234 RepID=A0A6A5G0X7_CAERE|nr:hypothetical protein GCK72_025073 [Caenorhabditis remanei]KAF1748606.1 hypothetical protein GCK72_025073 [Caenorhabditis remanei]
MDTLRTCHTFIIIFDNLITLVCFIVPEYTLLFQVSWTREKFLKILEILTTDLLGGDTNTPQDSLSDCGLADDCLKTGNGTIVGILEKLQLKTTDVPETILDEDDPESALYTFVTVVLFGFVSYVFSVIS